MKYYNHDSYYSNYAESYYAESLELFMCSTIPGDASFHAHYFPLYYYTFIATSESEAISHKTKG